MSDFFKVPVGSEVEEKRRILSLAQGRCTCISFHHDHRHPCKRRLYSTYKFVPTANDGSRINSHTWIVVCSTCYRYIKDVGY